MMPRGDKDKNDEFSIQKMAVKVKYAMALYPKIMSQRVHLIWKVLLLYQKLHNYRALCCSAI